MRRLSSLLLLCACTKAPPVLIPEGLDHHDFQLLLERYVDERGLVAYDLWRDNPEDVERLDRYLSQYETRGTSDAKGEFRQASLINLYNALTLREVLRINPQVSFWTPNPFKKRIHRVSGKALSLDDIEHRAARPEIGFRVHSALVCAAKSCPPLRREAFSGEGLTAQLDDQMRTWLGREDLHHFRPETGEAELSKIFSWFEEDFIEAGGVKSVLKAYGPPKAVAAASHDSFSWTILPYDKSLNAQPVAAPISSP